MRIVQGWDGKKWVAIDTSLLPLGPTAVRIVEVYKYWICYKEEEKVSLIFPKQYQENTYFQ